MWPGGTPVKVVTFTTCFARVSQHHGPVPLASTDSTMVSGDKVQCTQEGLGCLGCYALKLCWRMGSGIGGPATTLLGYLVKNIFCSLHLLPKMCHQDPMPRLGGTVQISTRELASHLA